MTTTDRPKLGGLFTSPATTRPDELVGILEQAPSVSATTPAPPPLAPRAQPEDAAKTVAARRGGRRPSEPRTRRTTPATADHAVAGVGNQVVPVVLDASVLAELRSFASRTEQTHGAVALRAIEAHANELAKHWTQHRPTVQPGRLFGTTTTAHRRTEPGVQTQLRISSADAATLDNLVTDWAAPSRSALVNEALRRYVFTSDESRPAV